jgi:hypothetical protein
MKCGKWSAENDVGKFMWVTFSGDICRIFKWGNLGGDICRIYLSEVILTTYIY